MVGWHVLYIYIRLANVNPRWIYIICAKYKGSEAIIAVAIKDQIAHTLKLEGLNIKGCIINGRNLSQI